MLVGGVKFLLFARAFAAALRRNSRASIPSFEMKAAFLVSLGPGSL